MKYTGLSCEEVEKSRINNGANNLTEIEPEPLWKKIMEGFQDPMIMILMVALVIQVVLYFFGQAEWFEPAGILVAILIANGVAAVSENQQEDKAAILRADEEAKDMTKVIRESTLMEIKVSDVVVGDIIYLQAGDKIPADGVILDGTIKVDQSALNGETEEADKQGPATDEYNIDDLLNKHYVYRGTVVCDKEAYVEVKVVGDNTLFGKLSLEVQEETRETPLQVKLGKLAQQISTFGYVGAVAIVLGILIKTFVTSELPVGIYAWVRLIMDAITVAVTIIVCAVPEGLPMLTSILLSFQSIRMEKDNVLVKKINGLETSGSLSMLFTDKTGTITEGKLSIADIVTADCKPVRALETANKVFCSEIVYGIGLNNGAKISKGTVIGGNSTDRALAAFLIEKNLDNQIDYDQIIETSMFNSKDKYGTAKVRVGNIEAEYIKGAPEIILGGCRRYIDTNGNEHDIANLQDKLQEYIDAQAERAMRLLAVAKVEKDKNDLTLICVLSIRDNIRREAVAAIKEVQSAGIQVVMVTGDKKETAVAIAKEVGLLNVAGIEKIAIASDELKAKSDDEIKAILPNIGVVARALPTDKSRLVKLAQEMDYVVGMTGDGVNDSPALKRADVGFAMGSGTEVAKAAGDITILDDNFASIAKAILYGRTMFKSIRKFLIFQLTVNVAAVLICFLAPLFGENVVLTVIQLLLINLAMDTLAAIAFGSEPALKEYMKDAPVARQESIISRKMGIEVICSSLYITFACLAILFVPSIRGMFGDVDMVYLKSALFATFMMAIAFNGFNARTDSLNVFENLMRNLNFLLVTAAILIMQFAFVEFGGDVLSVEALKSADWGKCAVIAFLVVPLDVVRKIFVK